MSKLAASNFFYEDGAEVKPVTTKIGERKNESRSARENETRSVLDPVAHIINLRLNDSPSTLSLQN